MQKLTEQASQKVNDLAKSYHVSTEAVMCLLQAVQNGNGTMAQFSHAELGGSGQWMQGGMTMVGDMSNDSKKKVEGLCADLAQLLKQNPFLSQPGHSSSRQADNSANWWPSELGSPNSSGGQNDIRYAYFAKERRLAVERNGHITIYDTLNHQISGVSQQQGSGGSSSLSFNSQLGTVELADLPVVSS